MLSREIISNTAARGKRRVVFRHVDGPVIYGPFIEHIPTGQVNAFTAAHRDSMQADVDRPPINRPRQLLRHMFQNHTDAEVMEALDITAQQLANLKSRLGAD